MPARRARSAHRPTALAATRGVEPESVAARDHGLPCLRRPIVTIIGRRLAAVSAGVGSTCSRLRCDRGLDGDRALGVLLDPRGDRGHPVGEVRRRGGRRGPRERRRPDHRGAVRDAGGGQLHGDERARADLSLPDPGAVRRARVAADDRPERDAVRHRLHGLDRGARRRVHRDLGARQGAHDPGGDRPGRGPARSRAAGPRLPAARTAGGCPATVRSDGSGGRPRPPGGSRAGGGGLRGDERGRDDGPRARPDPVLRAARPAHDHGRRPDRVPSPHREARRARRVGEAAHRVRRVPGRRVPRAGHGQGARRAGEGRGGRRGGRARARALRVPHR